MIARMKRSSILVLIAAIAAAVAIAVVLRQLPRLPRLTDRDLAEAIQASIQRESDTTFVITGYLDVVGTVRSSDTQVFLPGLLNLRLGTSRSTVRVPGRVSYGFDIGQLTPERVHLYGDTIEIEIPLVAIYSAEPDLSRLEVETSAGWARTSVSAREVERRAVQLLSEALQRQGTTHLRSSLQPEVNTARALQRMVEPVVIRLGIREPHFRFRIGEDILLGS
jgi:hypothetical protein